MSKQMDGCKLQSLLYTAFDGKVIDMVSDSPDGLWPSGYPERESSPVSL
jgi:hypothetical protein